MDNGLIIERVNNGYIIKYPKEEEDVLQSKIVIEDNDKDELESHEDLLWEVMKYFNFGGSKHDKERIRITREKRAESNDCPF